MVLCAGQLGADEAVEADSLLSGYDRKSAVEGRLGSFGPPFDQYSERQDYLTFDAGMNSSVSRILRSFFSSFSESKISAFLSRFFSIHSRSAFLMISDILARLRKAIARALS
jgi:hypothetical protein